MFGRKKDNQDIQARFDKLAAEFLPNLAIPIAKIGGEQLEENIRVDFIYVVVESKDAAAFAVRCATVFEIAASHGAIIVANAGGVIQLAVGPRDDMADCAPLRLQIADQIANALERGARIVHGRAQSHVGVAGSEHRRNWGFFPIQLMAILTALTTSNPGISVDLGDLS
jgi:hypothetical protein